MSTKQERTVEGELRMKLVEVEATLKHIKTELGIKDKALNEQTSRIGKLNDKLQTIEFEAAEAKAKVKTLINAIAIMSEAKRTECSPNNMPTYNMAYYPTWQWPAGYMR